MKPVRKGAWKGIVCVNASVKSFWSYPWIPIKCVQYLADSCSDRRRDLSMFYVLVSTEQNILNSFKYQKFNKSTTDYEMFSFVGLASFSKRVNPKQMNVHCFCTCAIFYVLFFLFFHQTIWVGGGVYTEHLCILMFKVHYCCLLVYMYIVNITRFQDEREATFFTILIVCVIKVRMIHEVSAEY